MSRFARNTTAVTAAFLANTTLSFLQVKLLTRWLPQVELGEYFATVALGALVSVVAQAGLPMVVLRFTAKYDALGDFHRIGRLVRFAWGLVLALSAVLLAAEWRWMPGILARLYETPPAVAHVLLATGVFVAMALRQVTYACFDGLRRMTYPALFENLNIGVITLCIVLMRERLSAILLLELSLISGTLVMALAAFWLLGLITREARAPGPADVAGKPARPVPLLPDILPFWSGAALNGLVGICFGYADKLLISLFLPFQLVSIFYVAERLTFLMKRLLAVPLQVASPEMTRRWELGRREELRHDLGLMLKLQLAAAMLVAILAFALAEPAVLLVSSPAYLEAAGLLRVLAVSVLLMALYAPVTTFMRAIERIHIALLSDVMWIAIYIGGGALLVPRLGLAGMVLAQLVASLVTATYNLAVGQRVGRIVWDLAGVAKIAVLGISLATVGTVVVGRLEPDAWPAMILVALGVVVLDQLLLIGSGALSADDRGRLRALAGSHRLAVLADHLLFWPLGRGGAPVSRPDG